MSYPTLPLPPPLLPLPGPLGQHTVAPPSLATSAMEPLAPNAGTTSWKSAPAARIISPCKTTRLLCSGSLPSPTHRPPAPPPTPTRPPPLPQALVKWADLLTARLDTRKLVDNGSQTRRPSVSISPAEIASPPTAPPAALTYLTGPQSFKQGQLDLLSWTKDSLVTPACTICLSVYSR